MRKKVSTWVGCPQKMGVHKVGVYCNWTLVSTLLRGNSTLGRKTTVHISEVSTVHTSETYIIGLYKENKRAGQKVPTWVGCPHRWGVHKAGFYCISHVSVGNSITISHAQTAGHMTVIFGMAVGLDQYTRCWKLSILILGNYQHPLYDK